MFGPTGFSRAYAELRLPEPDAGMTQDVKNDAISLDFTSLPSYNEDVQSEAVGRQAPQNAKVFTNAVP